MHRWVKLRLHVYVCRKCGTGRVNAMDFNGRWFTTWYPPDGSQIVAPRVPRCAPGPRTAAALRKYAAALEPR